MVALLVGASSAVLAVGCSDADPDPAEVRQEVVRNRLEETFSDAQADCIMARLDDSVLRALDRDGDLDPDGDAMATYTEAVTTCVQDPAAPPSGTDSDEGEQPDDQQPSDSGDEPTGD